MVKKSSLGKGFVVNRKGMLVEDRPGKDISWMVGHQGNEKPLLALRMQFLHVAYCLSRMKTIAFP